VKTNRSHRGCSFCSFASECVRLHVSNPGGLVLKPLYVDDKNATRLDCTMHNRLRGISGSLHPTDDVDSGEPQRIQLELQIQSRDEDYRPVGFIREIHADCGERPPVCSGRLVPRILRDFSLIRSWIDRCLVDHCTSCKIVNRRNSSLVAFFLIDTHDLRLIHSTEPRGSLAYVILSYVWGKRQFLNLTETSLPMFHRADGFSKLYPSILQIIRDAIIWCCEISPDHKLFGANDCAIHLDGRIERGPEGRVVYAKPENILTTIQMHKLRMSRPSIH